MFRTVCDLKSVDIQRVEQWNNGTIGSINCFTDLCMFVHATKRENIQFITKSFPKQKRY